jgi:5'(3')-deoxyribonucleotidase
MSIVGIDLDDVLFNFISRFTEIANKRFGRPVPGTPPCDWEWSNFGLNRTELSTVWDDIKFTPRFWESLELIDGVTPAKLVALESLHTVYYPTARVDTMGDCAAKQSACAIRARLGIEFPTVFAAKDKVPLARVLKYDYFIDDRPRNCIAILTALPGCKVYLKNSSHNATCVNNQLTRVATFDDFAQIVLEGR